MCRHAVHARFKLVSTWRRRVDDGGRDTFLPPAATPLHVTLIETLSGFEQKQHVRIETEDETTVEATINQFDYVPDEKLRLELAPEGSGEYERYQVRAHVEDESWTPVGLRGYDQERGAWTDLGTVADATPADRSTEPEAEESQAETSTDDADT